jgi:hypothetical protein
MQCPKLPARGSGRPLADDNEADALWILEYARREILGEAAA